MKKTAILSLSLILLTTAGSFSQGITITHLANQGVLITSNQTKISIDGLFEQEFDYLDVLSVEQQLKIQSADTPFDQIQFILATHFHGDHFGSEIVTKYLETHPKSKFISTNETMSKLNEEEKESLGNQLISSTPELHTAINLISLEDLKIKVIRVKHLGTSPWNEAENVAYLIEVSGKKILHWGDGEITKENLFQLNLQKENIDVAILPVFAIASPDHKTLIDEYISSKNIILSHIPLGASESQLSSMRKMFSNAQIWNKQFEKLEL